jgi:hypothetical protein
LDIYQIPLFIRGRGGAVARDFLHVPSESPNEEKMGMMMCICQIMSIFAKE